MEDEIADGVGALDREGIGIKGCEEPGVFCSDELARFIVGPELNSLVPETIET